MQNDDRKTPLSEMSNRQAGYYAKDIARILTVISKEKDRTIASSCAMMLASLCHSSNAALFIINIDQLSIGEEDTGTWRVTVSKEAEPETPVVKDPERRASFDLVGDVRGMNNRLHTTASFFWQALRVLFIGRMALIVNKRIPLAGFTFEESKQVPHA